jgi:hypothetical protein
MLGPTLLATIINFGCKGIPGAAKACTLIGCEDAFNATVTNGPSGFPVGPHQIDVTADGVTISCTFTFPLPKLADGADSGPQCPPGLMVSVGPAVACTQFQPGPGAVGERCDPIAGKTTEMLDVSGTPARVRVRQTTNGVVVLDESVTPVYASNQPNGPGCDPICHQAGAEWTLADLTVGDGGLEQ